VHLKNFCTFESVERKTDKTKNLIDMNNFKKLTAQTFLNEINRLNRAIDKASILSEDHEYILRDELFNLNEMAITIFEMGDVNSQRIKEILKAI
jgi:hypothetical protein